MIYNPPPRLARTAFPGPPSLFFLFFFSFFPALAKIGLIQSLFWYNRGPPFFPEHPPSVPRASGERPAGVGHAPQNRLWSHFGRPENHQNPSQICVFGQHGGSRGALRERSKKQPKNKKSSKYITNMCICCIAFFLL